MTSAVPTEGHGHSARRSFEEALQGLSTEDTAATTPVVAGSFPPCNQAENV